MFVVELTNNQKGVAAEAVIEAEALKHGVTVYRPLSGHSRADQIFDVGGRLLRVQVKHGHLGPGGDVLIVNTGGSYLSAAGYVRSTYAVHEIDLLAVWSSELDRCFLLPPSIFAGRSVVHLRLTPSRNNQRACITLADDFDFIGAVAQLEERRHGMAEARGSSPLSSTLSSSEQSPARTIGSDELRLTLGQVIDQVAAGEEIIVTRRGTPRIRLSPAAPGPPVAPPGLWEDQAHER